MKKFFNKATMQNTWKSVMASTKKAMSRGAQSINRIITWARGENWRGNRNRKK